MKDLKWGKILSVGVEEIDEDHRKLVEIFNVLNHAVAEDESPDYLRAVLEELINCTVWHFSHEERLMLKYRYSDAAAHAQEHRERIDSARELQQKLLQGGQTVNEEHIAFLERWLTEHILTADQKLGSFLYEAM
jgi:hemerythrin-like metal-binding protein